MLDLGVVRWSPPAFTMTFISFTFFKMKIKNVHIMINKENEAQLRKVIGTVVS